jgi:hypothetical protein
MQHMTTNTTQTHPDAAWELLLPQVGKMLRPGAKDGGTARMRVIARTYLVKKAAKRLGVRVRVLEAAAQNGVITILTDPDGGRRIPAMEIESAHRNEGRREAIVAYEQVRVRHIAVVAGMSYATAQRRLAKEGLSRTEPNWGDVRGKWGLPNTLREFLIVTDAKMQAWLAKRTANEKRAWQDVLEKDWQEREALRERLLAAFPAWKHEGRKAQMVKLHVGPPNSGKTHDALKALAKAGSGWYLAPLRLLAFEIFDRLNARGVYCNLLTGEEYIPVPGATITAATIEMFDPANSGQCVIIDEAHMLTDESRGWAWTRALMEAQAPEIRVIAPPGAADLIKQMVKAAGMHFRTVKHERLTPIKVAERPWRLRDIPPRTILVAFSRAAVLELKAALEDMGRSVAVVYGNLPPEVRRRQADRFAEGEAEICIATDAVGMGLNLPADYVCFYEVEKYDGKEKRPLNAAEVHQIGGRAGRYGLSKGGEIGATSREDLNILQQLFNTQPPVLTFARIAPTVQDLEMIPGNLPQRLQQWATLESIPEALRPMLKTADMGERVALAAMLREREVEYLGLANAIKLVNAPTRRSTREYWLSCVLAIIRDERMPLPPIPPRTILSDNDLERIETCIHCADVYLWLSQRREFDYYAPHADKVRIQRGEWSSKIDDALQNRITSGKACRQCGKKLPNRYPYPLCDDCYYNGREARGGQRNGKQGHKEGGRAHGKKVKASERK